VTLTSIQAVVNSNSDAVRRRRRKGPPDELLDPSFWALDISPKPMTQAKDGFSTRDNSWALVMTFLFLSYFQALDHTVENALFSLIRSSNNPGKAEAAPPPVTYVGCVRMDVPLPTKYMRWWTSQDEMPKDVVSFYISLQLLHSIRPFFPLLTYLFSSPSWDLKAPYVTLSLSSSCEEKRHRY